VLLAPAACISEGCKSGLCRDAAVLRAPPRRRTRCARDMSAEHARWARAYPAAPRYAERRPQRAQRWGAPVARHARPALRAPLGGAHPRRSRRWELLLRRGRPRARRACGAPPTPRARQQVGEALAQLAEVVGAFEEALDPADARRGEAELASVLAGALEPLLEMCERSAEALSVDHPARRGAWGRVPMPRLRSPGARAAAPGPATHTRRRAGPPGAPTARRRAAPAPARPRARRARAGAPGGAAAPRAGWTRRARSTRPRSAST